MLKGDVDTEQNGESNDGQQENQGGCKVDIPDPIADKEMDSPFTRKCNADGIGGLVGAGSRGFASYYFQHKFPARSIATSIPQPDCRAAINARSFHPAPRPRRNGLATGQSKA
jgi:hypothetical protein